MKVKIELGEKEQRQIVVNNLTIFTGNSILWERDLISGLMRAKALDGGTWTPPVEATDESDSVEFFKERVSGPRNPVLLEHLEKIIGGYYRHNNDETWSFITKDGDDWWLNNRYFPTFLYRLRRLYLLLKHTLIPDYYSNWIILVHPEDGFCPAKQRELAHFIAHMINQVYKVILFTNSSVIIDELCLLCALNKKRGMKRVLASLPDERKSYLMDHRQIAAYDLYNGKLETVKVSSIGIPISSMDDDMSDSLELWQQVL